MRYLIITVVCASILFAFSGLTLQNKMHAISCPKGSSSQSFTSPGTYNTSVPGCGRVLVSVTANGAGGGGAGGNVSEWNCTESYGGSGGNGGKAITTLHIAAGTQLTVVVGAGGPGGSWGDSSGECIAVGAPTNGANGGASSVTASSLIARGDGGNGGIAVPPQDGSHGGGVGDSVQTGGGAAGGAGGYGHGGNGSPGANGSVTINYSW